MALSNNGDIITSPQTITGSWADVGIEIETLSYSFFGSYIELDINDSKNVQFRYKALNSTGGSEYSLPFKTIKKDKVLLDDYPFEINSDTDQNIIIETEIDQAVPIIKLQVRALTVGATAGIIETATYRQGYRQ